jgi:GT2 family glycosyltransferase
MTISQEKEGQLEASIVIVSFNTRDLLRDCLESVYREAGPLGIEVFVVDNASSDGSAEMVAQEFPQVKLLRSDVNLGFGVANNVALEQAQGRYFVLLNSDAFFEAGSLARAIEHMDSEPTCAYGAARLIDRDGSWQPSARVFHSVFRDLTTLTGTAARHSGSRLLGGIDARWEDQERARETDWGPGAFAILRPEALRETGLFDPDFFLYYEEVDLCRRIKAAGYSVWYWPDIVVVHIGGESSRRLKTLNISSMSPQVVSWRMRSTLLYYRKHHGARAWLARMMESSFYRAVAWRNRLARRDPECKLKAERNETLATLMEQAWKDTNGGRVSPPKPW